MVGELKAKDRWDKEKSKNKSTKRTGKNNKKSILSLHLCKEYLAAVKLRTLFLLQIKY